MASPQVTYRSEKLSTKMVYYTGGDTLQEGYALCYDRDAGTAGEADGARAYQAEKPAAGNLKHFAGVVHPSSAGKTGPCWVKVIVPESRGVLCNVHADQDCTRLVTRLAVQAGSYALGAAGADSVAVATAAQTVDRSSDPGCVQAVLEGAGGPAATDAAAAVSQTQSALTGATGTADGALEEVVGTSAGDLGAAQAESINNNFKEVHLKLEAVRADLAAVLTALKNANLMASS